MGNIFLILWLDILLRIYNYLFYPLLHNLIFCLLDVLFLLMFFCLHVCTFLRSWHLKFHLMFWLRFLYFWFGLVLRLEMLLLGYRQWLCYHWLIFSHDWLQLGDFYSKVHWLIYLIYCSQLLGCRILCILSW